MLDEEMKTLKALIPNAVEKPLDILLHVVASNAADDFPNFSTALRILLQYRMPVTVASGEHSFSELKLIKSYLRSFMGHGRLNNLAILSVENDIAHSLNYADVIDLFAAVKCRKVSL